MIEARKSALARSLRTPGTVVERHRGVGIMPNSIIVALDRDPSVRVRTVVPPGTRDACARRRRRPRAYQGWHHLHLRDRLRAALVHVTAAPQSRAIKRYDIGAAPRSISSSL